MSCKTCTYFQDCECRRHAPHMLLLRENRITVWPLVTPEKWCGDYTEKPDADAAQS